MCTMVIDGGKLEIKAQAWCFDPSDKPLPTANEPASPMDKYEIKKYKEAKHLSEETIAFSAEIWYDGKPFLHAQNRGHGGCNLYSTMQGAAIRCHEAEQQFIKDAEAWARQNGAKGDLIEVHDIWIAWHTHRRPHGETAAQHWAGWNEMLSV